LEELHGVEIRISPRRSLEEDTNVEVVHFIISHGHIRWSEIGFLSVRNKEGDILLGDSGESLVSSLNELLCVDITSSSNNKVSSDVVSFNVILDIFLSDVVNIFSNTMRRLANVVVSVWSEVNWFKDNSLLIILSVDSVVVDCFFLSFDLGFVKDGVL
jgi:hypothetical protein